MERSFPQGPYGPLTCYKALLFLSLAFDAGPICTMPVVQQTWLQGGPITLNEAELQVQQRLETSMNEFRNISEVCTTSVSLVAIVR